MSILVTGGAGYIGSHMVVELCDAGEKVVVIDNLSTGFRQAVPDEVPLIVGDIGDQSLVDDVIGTHKVNAIIHFAGSVVVPDSVVDPLGYYNNNTIKSRSLLESAVVNAVPHFIFSSTAAVYGIPNVNPVSEDTPLNPISPYGASKLMTEWMLRDVAKVHEVEYVTLRYFNVAGADPKGRVGQSTARATHLIKVASQVALGGRSHLDIYGRDYNTPDGTCIRDYIHVTDLARAHLQALAYLRAGGQSAVFNCGYGHGMSVLEVIGAVERAIGRKIEANDAKRRAGDPPTLVAGVERIHQILGWNPEYDDIDQIVTSALAWERQLIDQSSAA